MCDAGDLLFICRRDVCNAGDLTYFEGDMFAKQDI